MQKTNKYNFKKFKKHSIIIGIITSVIAIAVGFKDVLAFLLVAHMLTYTLCDLMG